MARAAHNIADLSDRAQPGARITVRVTPRAAREGVEIDADGTIRVRVTAPPADGRANDAVQALLARATGLARTRLVLSAGAGSRDKTFTVV